MSSDIGTLYIVPTPIGNLQDITERARDVLARVTTIAAEDTRRCRKLLQLLDIPTVREGPNTQVRVVPLHEHNEAAAIDGLLAALAAGEQLALLSDAGTPLVSDPGHLLLRALWAARTDPESVLHNVTIVPLPGPSAVLTALSACPLPLHQFSFAGFLPAKQAARQSRLRELLNLPGAFVLFEAPHRVAYTLEELAQLAATRQVFVARELTKLHESLLMGSAAEVLEHLTASNALRGEFVLVVEGPPSAQKGSGLDVDAHALLMALADELPPGQAAKIAARLTGGKRADYYALLQDRAGE